MVKGFAWCRWDQTNAWVWRPSALEHWLDDWGFQGDLLVWTRHLPEGEGVGVRGEGKKTLAKLIRNIYSAGFFWRKVCKTKTKWLITPKVGQWPKCFREDWTTVIKTKSFCSNTVMQEKLRSMNIRGCTVCMNKFLIVECLGFNIHAHYFRMAQIFRRPTQY